MVGGSLAGGFGGIGDMTGGVCRVGDEGTAFADRTGQLGGSASVDIELDCGTVTVATAPGSGWAVRGTDGDGQGRDVSASDDELDVQPADDDVPVRPGSSTCRPSRLLDVGLQLNAGSAPGRRSAARGSRAVDLEVNAGQAVLDLTGVTDIDGIDVGVNAGEVGVTLPSHAMTGGIEVNAGSVRLCAPADVALRIETEGSVLRRRRPGELGPRRGRGRLGDARATTPPRRASSCDVQANLGSIRLDPSEGCA